MTAAAVASAYAPRAVDSRLRRVVVGLRSLARRGVRFRLRCMVLGHDDSFLREPQRLSLRCTACGRETAGWSIGPGAPAEMSTGKRPPSRGSAAIAAAFRWWPWIRRQWQARGETRDRQRLRLVEAAARASERRPDDSVPVEVRPDRGQARLVAGERQPVLAIERQPDRWTANPPVQSVPPQNGLRADRPRRQGATRRRSIR